MVLLCCSIGVWLVQKGWGLQGHYYANPDWNEKPAITQVDTMPYLSGAVGENILSAAVFSVKWKGWIAIPGTGVYRFATTSDDGSYLTIDNSLLIDNGGAHGAQRVSQKITLQKSVYPIEILYFQVGGYSVMRTFWTLPGASERLLPSHVLYSQRPGTIALLWRQGIRLCSLLLKIIWSCILFLLITIAVFILFKRDVGWVILLCGLAFWISYSSPMDYTGRDLIDLPGYCTARND